MIEFVYIGWVAFELSCILGGLDNTVGDIEMIERVEKKCVAFTLSCVLGALDDTVRYVVMKHFVTWR